MRATASADRVRHATMPGLRVRRWSTLARDEGPRQGAAVGLAHRGQTARQRSAQRGWLGSHHPIHWVRLENDSSVSLIRMPVVHNAAHHNATASRRLHCGRRLRPWPPEDGDGQSRRQAGERQQA